jgi:hypothetical protein
MKKKLKPVKLEDLLPARPVFFMQKRNKTFSIRPPNMADHVWFANKYGDGTRVAQILAGRDWAEITKIVYRLFTQENREAFKSTKAKVVNEDGDEAEIELKGPEVLLQELSGPGEATKMLAALNRAIIISNPELEKEVIESLKKSLKENGIELLTGPKSTT